MGRLFKAFLFKLKRDLTFRITLFIGIGLAIFLTLIYFGIDLITANENNIPLSELANKNCSGQAMLMNSFSQTQNFGLSIPINLISFISLEFTYGTIRNKIIAGNSKFKIYTGLFVSGLVFSLSLIIIYVLICFGLGTIIGGFNPNGSTAPFFGFIPTNINWDFLLRFIFINLLTYVTLTSFAVMVVTVIRHIGGSIPIVLIVIIFAAMFGSISSLIAYGGTDLDGLIWALRILDPFYASNAMEFKTLEGGTLLRIISNESFIVSIISNIVYTALFFFGGALIFRKRDVK